MSGAKLKLWAAAVGIILPLGIGALFWKRRVEPASVTRGSSSITSSKPGQVSDPGRSRGLLEMLQTSAAGLQSSQEPASVRQRLEELRQALAHANKDEAVAGIRKLLDARIDAPTHQGFSVSANGFLNEAPTLRVFLLDYLGQLDPEAAAEYARKILGTKDSADEWAVALRNMARGDNSAEGRALLEQKTGELLREQPWYQNPSVGYLEAFDVAVYLGGANLMSALTDLVRKQDNPAVAHAAFLALDRLVVNDPATTLAALQAAPELMQGRELTRANYFARADVRDPQQRQILEKYLFDPRIGPAELDAFAGVFPNANFMISPNLLTQTPTPDHAALVARDAESLRVVQQWLGDPRFANLHPGLEKLTSRLEGFVRQANGH